MTICLKNVSIEMCVNHCMLVYISIIKCSFDFFQHTFSAFKIHNEYIYIILLILIVCLHLECSTFLEYFQIHNLCSFAVVAWLYKPFLINIELSIFFFLLCSKINILLCFFVYNTFSFSSSFSFFFFFEYHKYDHWYGNVKIHISIKPFF